MEGSGERSVGSGAGRGASAAGSGHGTPGVAGTTLASAASRTSAISRTSEGGRSSSRRGAPPDPPRVAPLRQWIRDEARRKSDEERSHRGAGAARDAIGIKHRSLIRKVTVAYSIAELLVYRRRDGAAKGEGGDGEAGAGNGRGNGGDGSDVKSEGSGKDNDEGNRSDNGSGSVSGNSSVSGREQERDFGADDFAVLLAPTDASWMDVEGVRTTTTSVVSKSPLSVRVSEPFYVRDLAEDDDRGGRTGRYLEAEISIGGDAAAERDSEREAGRGGGDDRRSFGALLHELISGARPLPPPSASDAIGADSTGGSWNSTEVRRDDKKRRGESRGTAAPRLRELGHPSSLCRMTSDLLNGSYRSLEAVRDDLHLMLRDPDCFLFDAEDAPPPAADAPSGEAYGGGAKGPRTRKDKLYGREEEAAMITDAFCRVSAGEDAAFFVGGYSGSGKTMLVQSLIARVEVSGGYVLTQKIDQISRDRPLLGVLSAFDELCTLIKRKSRPRELLDISNQLGRVFETDCAVLARLLPNVNLLFPQLANLPVELKRNEVTINVHTVSFALQRFVRIVSSRQKPVMLFYDDLQWATSPTLELIEALLTDARGASCFFFVGSYRDNEVGKDHPVLDLIAALESHSVHTTKLSLRGLRQGDLNTMVAEMLGVLPRLCRTLSDIVYEKTQGNPLFALEFMRSLVESRLLTYSLRDRQWIWEEGRISQEDITDNVLYLLTAKMKSFPENVQSALKVLSCFGIRTIESIVNYLSSTAQYPDLRQCLDDGIRQGCLIKAGSEFKFVHDKVREAVYGLIPQAEKKKFHFDMGMLLYSATKGKELGSTIYPIADQLNHGTPSSIQPDMRMDITKLNFKAGSSAMNSDFATALSYFNHALELLEQVEGHWSSHYELCLQLFFLHAKAAYSCGNIEKAYDSLRKIVERGRCMKDKLDAYYFYATILNACEESNGAYTLCEEVLSQLEEEVPKSIDKKTLMGMMTKTGQMLAKTSAEDLLKMKEIDGAHRTSMKFFTFMLSISYWIKPEMMPYFCCRVVQLSLEHGLCEDSVVGIDQYAGVLLEKCKEIPAIREACRVAKAAMTLHRERYDSSEIVPRLYFGFVGHYFEPMKVCADSLCKGFAVGIAVGDAATAFYNTIRLNLVGMLAGVNLKTLLEELDRHAEAMTCLHVKIAKNSHMIQRETLLILLDSGHSTGSLAGEDDMPSIRDPIHEKAVIIHKLLQSFWLGYSQRTDHYAKKALGTFGGMTRLVALFYAALNAFRGIKNRNGIGSIFIKAKSLYEDAIAELRVAAEICPVNYRNKVHLLEAEMGSFEKKNDDAQGEDGMIAWHVVSQRDFDTFMSSPPDPLFDDVASYAAAITSSRTSNLMHEQALAYEHAALHYKRIGETQMSLDFFMQAKSCYKEWGSNLKVKNITQQIDRMESEIHRPTDE
ncbi:hypothetical protein ACHAWF_016711 [Thalassiosira exigua]